MIRFKLIRDDRTPCCEFSKSDVKFISLAKRMHHDCIRGVKLCAAEIKKCVAMSINNVVALACLEVNEVQDLLLYVTIKPPLH